MNKIVFLIFNSFLFILPIYAQRGSEEAFQLYAKGQYEAALNQYQALIDQFGGSSDLYFNTGLCQLQLQHIGSAKLDFERALILKPHSAQIRAQLSLINQSIEPKIEALPSFFIYKWIVTVRDFFNQSIWGWITLFCSLCFGLLTILHSVLDRPYPNWFYGIVITGGLISGSFFLARHAYEQAQNGILMISNPLKIAPESNAQDLLPLGVGTKMQLIDSLRDWYKIQLENNDQGWVPKSALNKI